MVENTWLHFQKMVGLEKSFRPNGKDFFIAWYFSFFFIFIKNYSIYAQCDHPFSENVTSVEKCSLELRVSMFVVCPLPSNRIHLEPLSHILDKVGSLLPINKFFVVFYPTLSAGGIQKLFFCEYPSLPRHLHNSEENGKDACSSEIHRTGLNL